MNDLSIITDTHQGKVKVEQLKGELYQFSGTNYRLDSAKAVVALVLKRGTPENTLILWDRDGIDVILDDQVMDRPQDRAEWKYKHSIELDAWMGLTQRSHTQKDFIDLLKRRDPKELEANGDGFLENLIASVRMLNIATEIVGDYQFEDNNNLSVFFKTKDGEAQTKLPQTFLVSIPVIYGSDAIWDLEFELELHKPQGERERPTFSFRCPKMLDYLDKAVAMEIDSIRMELQGYTILQGRAGPRK